MTDTHEGNDQAGAPTLHRGQLADCPAPECQDRVAEQQDDVPEPTATPAGQSIALHLTGYPYIPNRWGPGHIRPTGIRLDYGNQRTPDARLAHVFGLWVREDGEVTDAPVDRDYYAPNGDLSSWPPEIADLAKKHQPAAVSADQAPAPTDWIDGHPQLEAIAAGVWERCRTEDTSLVVDDPRNIAVAAYAAVLAMLPPAADRAEWDALCRDTGRLRKASAETVDRAERIEAEVQRLVNIRAAVLREAADGFNRHAAQILDGVGDKAVFVAKALRDQAAVWSEAAETLRRMASEAQPDTQDAKPWLTDSARIGRTLIWSWSDVGKGAFREGYRAAQAEARALLGGERGTEAPE